MHQHERLTSLRAVIDAQRGCRGPYTAAAALVQRVCQELAGAELAAHHLISLLSVAPELARQVAVPDETQAAFRFSREGNPNAWNARIAHGVTDFLVAFAETAGTPLSISFRNVGAADPTDRGFIDILRRRTESALLTVEIDEGSSMAADSVSAARAFICAGGALWCGTAVLDGDDDATVLLRASDLAMRMAFYAAALEWASHGRSRLDAGRIADWGKLTRNMLFALLLLGRIPEAEALCAAVQARDPDPEILAHVTYAMAILNVRLYERDKHDYDAAKAWIARSMDFTARLTASETNTVNQAFLMNTMALVEMRQGRAAAAFDLLNAGLHLMESEAPNKYPLECGILLHNRAKLNRAVRRPDRAIDDLSLLLQFEPSNSEAAFDRGLLQHRAARYDAALADYDAALRWSPPYWEPHFNRAQVLMTLGRQEAALRDYARVLVLNPEHADSRAHAHCLRGLSAIEHRDLDAAFENFTAAIAADPDLADAWANRATIYFKRGEFEAALRDLDRALTLRDDAEIFYNRGRVLESLARRGEAVADYRSALERGASDPEQIRRRLAAAQQEHGQPAAPAV